MQKGSSFRFMVVLSLVLAAAAVVVSRVYDLPLRDPDGGVAGPTYLRLPVILFAAFLTDVLPRAVWRARSVTRTPAAFVAVVRERWGWDHVRFALLGLGAWYLTYAAFRNLKSFVPFVNHRLYDEALGHFDAVVFLGHDPAVLLHSLLGTGFMAHVMSFIYIAWIVFVPASLVIALVWSRDVTGGAWYVTAVGVDWVLGVATYFVVPTLGPVYAKPGNFEGLSRTDVTGLQESMMADRHAVLADPFATHALQTIAAFASLHVGIMVTICVMAELLRSPKVVRWALWAFLALTVVCTLYTGWHYFADVLGGIVLGSAAVWIAALGTGNHARGIPVRRERETTLRELVSS